MDEHGDGNPPGIWSAGPGLYAYMTYFTSPNAATEAAAFAAALPAGCKAEITVLVRGPWEDPDDGDEVLRPLATRHGGDYDSWEEMPG